SPFPPIADYAFLSDGEVTALVAPSGCVEWLCLPRMDGPNILGALLARAADNFRLGPADNAVPVDRRYLPGTLVLETSWGTSTGWAIVRDAPVIVSWNEGVQPRNGYSRAPTDYAAEGILMRTVRCVNGEVQLTLECEPVFDDGRRRGVWAHGDRPYHSATCRDPDSDVSLRLTTDLRVGFEGPKAV